MQYFVSVIDDTPNSATDEEMAAITAYNEQIQASGNWVFAGGLAGPDAATVIDGRGDEPMFSDGPFAETKEYVAGFWVIEAADLDEALVIAAGGSKSCNRRVEIRPFARK